MKYSLLFHVSYFRDWTSHEIPEGFGNTLIMTYVYIKIRKITTIFNNNSCSVFYRVILCITRCEDDVIFHETQLVIVEQMLLTLHCYKVICFMLLVSGNRTPLNGSLYLSSQPHILYDAMTIKTVNVVHETNLVVVEQLLVVLQCYKEIS